MAVHGAHHQLPRGTGSLSTSTTPPGYAGWSTAGQGVVGGCTPAPPWVETSRPVVGDWRRESGDAAAGAGLMACDVTLDHQRHTATVVQASDSTTRSRSEMV